MEKKEIKPVVTKKVSIPKDKYEGLNDSQIKHLRRMEEAEK